MIISHGAENGILDLDRLFRKDTIVYDNNIPDAMKPGGGGKDIIVPYYKMTRYGIAEMHIVACFSEDAWQWWMTNIATGGVLHTFKGELKTLERDERIHEKGK